MRLLFDSDWYVRRYGSLPGDADAFEQYAREGLRLGHDPHPLFDSDWYTRTYPGLSDDVSPLEDFVAQPASRRPNRYFDPGLWLRHMARADEGVVEYLAGLELARTDVRTYASDRAVFRGVHAGRSRLVDDTRVCVYAHFDPHNTVDPYVLSALDSLVDAEWRTVFCTSCDRLPSSDIDEVRRRAAFVLLLPNAGLDWSLYHAGLGFVLDRAAPDSLALLNDSVYVDRRALPAFLDAVTAAGTDVVGATDSVELRPHLQSYFIHINRRALYGEIVQELLGHYVPVSEKRYVVSAYEVGFSRRAGELGLTVGAIYDYVSLLANAESKAEREHERPPPERLNPSRHLWDVLAATGSPFVKVQLLTGAPTDVPDLSALERRVEPELAALARAHARRIGMRTVRW